MVFNEILPFYLMIGVSKEEFMDSTPKELEPYKKAYEYKQKEKDCDMWQMGIYVLNAVSVAVNGALIGKKYKGEYLKKPLMLEKEDHEEEITEEKIKEERKKLLMQLQTMQVNFEMNHEK